MNDQTPPPMPQSPQPADKRIEITAEDLASPEVEQQVQALREAAAPQLIRSVGAPSSPEAGSWWRGGLASAAFAGLLGGVAGWALSELIMGGDGNERFFTDNPTMHVAMWMALVALGISALLTGWEGIEGRNGQKVLQAWKVSLPVTAVGGFLGGLVAQELYASFFEGALERAFGADSEQEFLEILEAGTRIPRAIGFLLAGAAIGVALGIATGAKQRAINGAIGGAIGGFAGGFLFSFVTTSGVIARALALSVTGVAIGAAIGLIEQARKEVWLEIVNGGMAGKQFILYHDTTTIGAAPGCHVTLIKDPHLAAHHASIVRGPSGAEVHAADPSAPVLVNGQAVQRSPVGDGDQVQMGTTLLRLGLREQATPTIAGMPPR